MLYTSPLTRFELTTSLVIGIDCIGSCKSNYHTITATTAPTSRFGDFVDRIYPIELEIKDSTDTYRSASYLILYIEIDIEGRLRTKLCDKRDDFNFPIVNFPFICSNIPAAFAYGVYISQLKRYS
jgi:hypothetical protein